MEHTPEPWRDVDGTIRGSVPDSSGYVDWIYEPYGLISPRDLRHIVACVNACKGVSTEDLENHGLEGVKWQPHMDGYTNGFEKGRESVKPCPCLFACLYGGECHPCYLSGMRGGRRGQGGHSDECYNCNGTKVVNKP